MLLLFYLFLLSSNGLTLPTQYYMDFVGQAAVRFFFCSLRTNIFSSIQDGTKIAAGLSSDAVQQAMQISETIATGQKNTTVEATFLGKQKTCTVTVDLIGCLLLCNATQGCDNMPGGCDQCAFKDVLSQFAGDPSGPCQLRLQRGTFFNHTENTPAGIRSNFIHVC